MTSAHRTVGDRLRAFVRQPAALLDIGLALGLSILAVAELRTDDGRGLGYTLVFVTVPLVARRTWPIPVLLLGALGVIATAGRASFVDVPAVAIASFSVGESVADRKLSPGIVLATAAGLAFGLLRADADPALSLTLPFVILVPAWVVGDALRAQRLRAQDRADAALRSLQEREARLAAALADERRHIARELHDVVAHAMSVVLLQTGAARQVLRTAPDRAEESLLIAEATGRDAMAELRRLLGVLADDDDAAGLAPQPGLAQLPALVDRVRDAGLPTELEIEGDARPIPVGVDVTIYRIAQEALTNALRYARAPTLVHLAYEGEVLRLEVLDQGPALPPPTPDAGGRGILGMQERATLVGGRLEAGPRLGGGFAVRAWLPIAAPDA